MSPLGRGWRASAVPSAPKGRLPPSLPRQWCDAEPDQCPLNTQRDTLVPSQTCLICVPFETLVRISSQAWTFLTRYLWPDTRSAVQSCLWILSSAVCSLSHRLASVCHLFSLRTTYSYITLYLLVSSFPVPPLSFNLEFLVQIFRITLSHNLNISITMNYLA